MQTEARAESLARGASFESKAKAFASLTQVWDPHTARRYLDASSIHADELRASVFWVHEQVGACVSYELESLRGAQDATFDLMCQRGNVTLTVTLGQDLAWAGHEILARGVLPSPDLQMALAYTNGWLSWGQPVPDFVDARTADSLLLSFEHGQHCRLSDVLEVGRHQASALYVCDDIYDRILTLRLDEKTGKISAAQLEPAGMPS